MHDMRVDCCHGEGGHGGIEENLETCHFDDEGALSGNM